MTSVDTNITNYTIPELLTILDLDDVDKDEVIKKTNEYIDKFSKEKKQDMVFFPKNAGCFT